jgi:hypothetical protein
VGQNKPTDNLEEDTYLCAVEEDTYLQNLCDNVPADNVDKAVTRGSGGGYIPVRSGGGYIPTKDNVAAVTRATRREEHACRYVSSSAYRQLLQERHVWKSTCA